MARLGTELAGTYQLKSVLGQGGMGVVYEAEHAWTGRRVAVKVIVREGEANANANQRALNEARLTTQLRHPNVVDVLDMGEHEPGVVYLAMEHLEGRPLSGVLLERGRLEPGYLLELLLPIIGAVATAHDAGILHRDLKPSNLFVSKRRDGVVVPKLLDFGIAKTSGADTLTKTGAVVGTPHYMAPEQATDGETSPAADIWALGVVLHECLRGERPFDGATPTATLLKIVNAPVPRLHEVAPWVPRALAAVVDRALERDSKRRLGSARDLARALLTAAVQDGIAVPGDPDPIGLPHWKQWRAELESATVSNQLAAVDAPADTTLESGSVTVTTAPVPRAAANWARRGVLAGIAFAGAIGIWLFAREPSPAAPVTGEEPALTTGAARVAQPASSPPAAAPVSSEAAPPTLPVASPPPAKPSARARQGSARTTPARAPSANPVAAPSATAPSPERKPSPSGIPELVHEW